MERKVTFFGMAFLTLALISWWMCLFLPPSSLYSHLALVFMSGFAAIAAIRYLKAAMHTTNE